MASRNTTVRALRELDTGFTLLTMVQDNSTKGLDNRQRGDGLRLLLRRQG